MKRKNEGITLVALIITVIVLIILASVTISMVVGDDGIITKAKEASQNMSNATAEEEELLQNMLNTMNEIESDVGGGNDSENSNIKEYHNGIPIPKGFYYVGGEAETGLVISDHPDDENEAVKAGQTGDITVPLKGNQFVWIPVKVEETDTETDIKAFKRTTTYDGTITDPGTNFTEPASIITELDETGEKAEYTEMYKSVYKYHGFYVGRYEAGCSTERTSGNRATEEGQGKKNPVLVQKDKFVYNYVPWGESTTSIAPSEGVIGAVELSRGMYQKEDERYGATSGLMYGVQWDAVMTFVNDAEHDVTNSSSWGNYSNYTGNGIYEKNQLQKTGINENWKVKNVYDLAGNAEEWTNETTYIILRTTRGGNHSSNGDILSASSRNNYGDTNDVDNDFLTFRPMLYVKLDTV